MERPPRGMLEKSLKQLQQLNIPIHNDMTVQLSLPAVELILSTAMEWIRSPEGIRHILQCTNITEYPADNTYEYWGKDGMGRPIKNLPHDKIRLIRGFLYEGRTVPLNMVEIRKKDLKACDDCGIIGPCITQVRSFAGGRDYLRDLCNHCRLQDENVNIKDTATKAACTECKSEGCDWHASRFNYSFTQNGSVALLPDRVSEI